MEGMDIDDYSRDRSRSRSPVRDRSRERRNSTTNSSSRDYRGGRSEGSRDYQGGNSRDYGTNRRFEERRGGYRGGRPSGGSRRDYGTSSTSDSDYRSKTERNYDNSIFISNVPFDSTPKDIEELFKGEFGVKRADIVTNRGRSRGMATVEFSSKADVQKAIEKFDKYDYNGRPLYIRQDYPPPEKKEFPPRREEFRGGRDRRDDYRSNRDDYRGGRDEFRGGRERREPPAPGTEVFIGNLPFSVNWQALKDLMRQAGEVVRADVKLDWSGNSKGFGTVVFSSVAEADKAIEMFQGYELEGRELNTRPGKVISTEGRERDSYEGSRGGRERRETPVQKNSEFTEGVEGDGEKSDTIYVSNLPFITSNDDLYELFETVGRTTKAEIQFNEQGKPSGNAVVQFEVADIAESAIQSLNNYNYGDRNLKITYAKRP
ncbi:uncharacterized protein RJT21DRAFT_36632 [Scheffersomyces amazonensis]|uniref:uncharacterized protein n=1 Tax=Scheffersomyces amazonensis TaxID=1078765 RepID=UPI00315D48F5